MVSISDVKEAIEAVRDDYDRDEIDAFSMSVDGDGDVSVSFSADYDMIIMFTNDEERAQALYAGDERVIDAMIDAYEDVCPSPVHGTSWLRWDQLDEEVQAAAKQDIDYDPGTGVANSYVSGWDLGDDGTLVRVTETVYGSGSVEHQTRYIVLTGDDEEAWLEAWDEGTYGDAHLTSALIRLADEAAGVEFYDGEE